MAVTVSDLFREYERDLVRLQEEIDATLQSAGEAPSGGSPGSLAEAARQASQADQALRQMDLEAKTLPMDQRSALEPVLRRHRAALGERRRQLAEAREAAERRALLPGSTAYGRPAERERMLEAGQKMQAASSRLEEARRQALEAEHIGMEVASDLRQQRETIVRARGSLGEAGSNYSVAKGVIESMQRRADANRLATRAVAVFMLLVLLVAGYFVLGGGGLGGGNKGPSGATPGSAGSSGDPPKSPAAKP